MIMKSGGLALGVLVIAGCASAEPPVLSFSEISHVHSVVSDGDDIILATHYGLHVWDGTGWAPRGESFDVMALVSYDGLLYASGHPGASQNLPDPLGLKVSADGGETWEHRSLLGEVDFHLLSVAAETIVGVAANYGEVVRSTDGGISWSTVNVPSLTDMSVSPHSSEELMVASEGSLLLSTDGGATFQPVEAPPGVQLITWTDDLVVVSIGSSLFYRANSAAGFVALPHEFRAISHLAVKGNKILVVDADGVSVSNDAGETFLALR